MLDNTTHTHKYYNEKTNVKSARQWNDEKRYKTNASPIWISIEMCEWNGNNKFYESTAYNTHNHIIIYIYTDIHITHLSILHIYTPKNIQFSCIWIYYILSRRNLIYVWSTMAFEFIARVLYMYIICILLVCVLDSFHEFEFKVLVWHVCVCICCATLRLYKIICFFFLFILEKQRLRTFFAFFCLCFHAYAVEWNIFLSLFL